MPRTVVKVLLAILVGVGVLVAMWPRECVRTLVGPVPGVDPMTLNRPRCTAIVGLPTSETVAYLSGVVSAIIVLALFAHSARRSGSRRSPRT